ncbi:MAG: hypothetical protein IKZ05_00910 [Clostridia bacterium]|nr:hypothetical protein [Clostridia bacterium]
MKNSIMKSVSKRSKLLLLIGSAFFINPVPFGLDILPDIIGALLLWYGLTQLAFFDGSVELARRYTLWLAVTEFIHLIAMRSVFLTDISSNRMLAVTVLAIVEGILYILIFKNLFSGISYFAMRNDANSTLSQSDGCAFMTYLAFFTRIGAMLLPELLAILEVKLNIVESFEKYDAISAFLGMKPIIVILLSAIALGVGFAWYFSIVKLIKALTAESGEELDTRYYGEYSSRPERTRPKRLHAAVCTVYFALFFLVDFSIDGARVIPASFMFAILFVACFIFSGIQEFKRTKLLALPAFFSLLACEIYTRILTPNGAVIIYETPILTVVFAAVLGIVSAALCTLCVNAFLSELNALSLTLGFGEAPTFLPWIAYCGAVVCRTLPFVIPYFHSFFYLPRLIFAAIFVWRVVKLLSDIYNRELERCALM